MLPSQEIVGKRSSHSESSTCDRRKIGSGTLRSLKPAATGNPNTAHGFLTKLPRVRSALLSTTRTRPKAAPEQSRVSTGTVVSVTASLMRLFAQWWPRKCDSPRASVPAQTDLQVRRKVQHTLAQKGPAHHNLPRRLSPAAKMGKGICVSRALGGGGVRCAKRVWVRVSRYRICGRGAGGTGAAGWGLAAGAAVSAAGIGAGTGRRNGDGVGSGATRGYGATPCAERYPRRDAVRCQALIRREVFCACAMAGC